ncbi:MAG: hypothetical protein ACOY4O_05005 [Pseudomonadota bacterium]|jgi:hypothetical protein
MSIKTKIAALALAALTVTGGIAASSQPAEAGHRHGLGLGIAAGVLGAAVVGSAIAAGSPGYYYDGYRRCGWVRQYDAWGNYVGKVRTCTY